MNAIISCRPNLFFKIIGEFIPLIFAVFVTSAFFCKISDITLSMELILIILTIIFLLWWAIAHFSVNRDLVVYIDELGIHNYFTLRICSFKFFEKHNLILWENIEKFKWFNIGYVVGYTIIGKNTSNKKQTFGISIFFTNVIQAVEFIIDRIPPNKVDPLVFKKLEKYKQKRVKKSNDSFC